MDKWINELSISDLDEKNKELAEIIGLEKLLELAEVYGGSRIYINKLDEMLKPIRDKKIIKEYNRYNVRELANKYNLAEESIRRIVREQALEGQMSIFDS